MNDITTIASHYRSATAPADLAKERLHDISDEHLVTIIFLPNRDAPTQFRMQLKPFGSDELTSSEWAELPSEPWQQWTMVEEIVWRLLGEMKNELWEVCGVNGCRIPSVGPCPDHASSL